MLRATSYTSSLAHMWCCASAPLSCFYRAISKLPLLYDSPTYKHFHTFSREKMVAGIECFYAFMRRNPQLSVRQPQATTLARVKGVNRDNILYFLHLLESNISKFWFTPDKIFNVDECGLSTVQKRPLK
jgi:hypothetical protein